MSRLSRMPRSFTFGLVLTATTLLGSVAIPVGHTIGSQVRSVSCSVVALACPRLTVNYQSGSEGDLVVQPEGTVPPSTDTTSSLTEPLSLCEQSVTWSECSAELYEERYDPDPGLWLEVFEDGSGIVWVAGHDVHHWVEGSWPWDCYTMGNRVCELPATT